MKILLTLLYLFAIESCYSKDSKFSLIGVSFNENGFPDEIKIRLYLDAEDDFRPDQLVVGGNAMDTRGLKDLKVIKKDNIYIVYEFTLNFKGYGKGDIVHIDFLNDWELLKISGPFMKIDDASGFVSVLHSGNWIAGFTVGETNNEEFYKKVAPYSK